MVFNTLKTHNKRRGQCLSPRTAPALSDVGRITFSGGIVFVIAAELTKKGDPGKDTKFF